MKYLNDAIEEFNNYTSNFDMKENALTVKYEHSFRVMEHCFTIAKSLKLSETDIKIVGLIGLLHDLGRFEQFKQYKTFMDNKSIDHGDLSSDILFKDNYIRKFIEDDSYDEIIRKSIKYHNKYEIGECNERELLFSKIIRDADKIDILYMYLNSYKENMIKNEDITPRVFDKCINKQPISFDDIITQMDQRILGIAMIYDINFKISFELIKENNISNIMFEILISKATKEENINMLKKLKDVMNNYIDEKVRSDTYVR